MDTRGQFGDSGCGAGDTHMDTSDQNGDSGCSAGDRLMDTRSSVVKLAAVLAIHVWIHVA